MCERAGLRVKVWTDARRDPCAHPVRERSPCITRYDGAWAEVFWRILVQVDRVLNLPSAGPFVGKSSPVHFFWGAFRSCGHPIFRQGGAAAPPRRAGVHARGVLSRGDQPRLLARQRPAARGSRSMPTRCPRQPGLLDRARSVRRLRTYHAELKEFVLPYSAVRSARRSGRSDPFVCRQHLRTGREA